MNALPRILIVDDEESIRDLLEMVFSGETVETIFAKNGEEGLHMAETFQPDAILLDVMMPGMDGYETCRQIRANPALTEIPIIMITALDDRESRMQGLLAGADDFLTKPFDGLELRVRIKNITRINRYRNLLAERSRFYWVVDDNEKGYLILGENGKIQYANHRAQTYLHLPLEYTNLDFEPQVNRYYQSHFAENEDEHRINENIRYLVQPETTTARAFWLRMETLNMTPSVEKQQLLRISNVTEEMSTYQDIRKIHTLVAHKLRTPLSLIYSSMNLLDSKMDFIPDDQIKPMVHSAWQNTERLVRDVRDILKFIDAPISLVGGAPVSLAELGYVANATGEILEVKEISVSIPEALAAQKLHISAHAMELIIYEILENSKKFHPNRSPSIQVRADMHGKNDIHLQFIDDGQIMTAEQIIHAKMPYLQSEKWFTGEVSGMGLGIPLVATMVWQAGGQLRVENRADQAGVCISLVLPIAPTETPLQEDTLIQ